MNNRELTYVEALREAVDLCMERDKSVYIMGLGVTDPKRIFTSTTDLIEKYGNKRVLEMPVSENGMTGVAIGSARVGMRPVLVHQRMDFALMSMDQIVNNAAKWNYMYGGNVCVPLTVRMIIGRGWGQGPQHSQNLQALFMHIPGLKVLMPFSPFDAKGLLISAIEDNNPVIFIEHRWLYNTSGYVPENYYTVSSDKARIVNEGNDITIITASYMVLESLRAVDMLKHFDVSVELLDLRCIKPLDVDAIVNSVNKTGKLIVVDSGYFTGGLTAEVSALAGEYSFNNLKAPVKRITTPDCPTPTSRALVKYYYPGAPTIARAALEMLELMPDKEFNAMLDNYENLPCDVPDRFFSGPF